jgi:protein subunit release factor A
MFEKLDQIEKNYEELTEQISSPEIMTDMKAYAKAMKQHRTLGEIVEKYREVKKMRADLEVHARWPTLPTTMTCARWSKTRSSISKSVYPWPKKN